ncbi:MAG: fumarylacetoacetate hydrolase family protein [Hyphomicrobiaceae bacterium]
MKLVRFGEFGKEKPGIVDPEGRVRDISAHVNDFTGEALSADGLARLGAIDVSSLPEVPADVRLGCPVADVRTFLAIGLNYADHAAETGAEIPRSPVVFNKVATCICGPNDDVMIPRDSTQLDWEVELAFVIGKRARYVDEADAADYIAGYTICNDVSERIFQTKRSGQWVKGKSAETFGPLGPWLVTPDELSDVDSLAMALDVNGVRRQTGNTSTMVYKVPFLLSHVSQFMVLEPGDVITTGTPPGVALGMETPAWLQPGDVMKLSIDGLGEQRQTVVPFKL